jgi:uncharacterized cupredoxin-like copper-binding protein
MNRIRITLAIAATIVLATLLIVPLAGARSSAAKATTVTVKMKEFKFILSRTRVPKGKITFVVINVGKINHDFKIKRLKTPAIKPGKRGKLVVTFTKAGRYPYLCVIGQHYKFGMKGVLKVT